MALKMPAFCKSILFNWEKKIKLCYYQWNASTVKFCFPRATGTERDIPGPNCLAPSYWPLIQSRWRAKLTDCKVSNWEGFPFWPYVQRCWTLTITAQFLRKTGWQHIQIRGKKKMPPIYNIAKGKITGPVKKRAQIQFLCNPGWHSPCMGTCTHIHTHICRWQYSSTQSITGRRECE